MLNKKINWPMEKKIRKQDMPLPAALTEIQRENNASKLLSCWRLCYSMRITGVSPLL